MPGVAVLPQAAGYGVTLGIGFFFSLLMIGISWVFNRYSGTKSGSAEEFTSASKSVKPGLIAAGIVSAWTWAATLLQSSAVGYKFGISGPWWYAAGACVQVMLFSMNASKLKKHAPDAHTFLEVIGARWGTAAHLTFMFFGLLTNIIVSSMLILGGSAVVHDISGMPTLAACFLIPVSVCVYVFFGGIRAALFCDYVHTTILLCFILVFMFTAYATSDKIGSPGAMYDLLVKAAERAPVDGNADGSYLTMRSVNGLIFGVINLIGNCKPYKGIDTWVYTNLVAFSVGTVFCDQSYWQRAVASKPSTAVKAFTLGGVSWFAVPFAMATTMGLTAVALTDHPDFPGFPSPLSPTEVTAGLPAPAAASALLGKTGATLMLVVLFLAVVSTSAAEMVAVSNIATFDIYKRYINPRAEGKQVLKVSKGTIVCWALVMGVLGTIWYYIGIGMGYLYLLMGCIIGSAVCPVALAIMSTRANKWGCIGGAWSGLFAGLIAWLVTTATLNDGEISIATTGADYPMLAGNLASLGTGVIVSVLSTLIWPENCDFTLVQEKIRNAAGLSGPVFVEKSAANSMDGANSPEMEQGKEGKDGSESPKDQAHTTIVREEEGPEIVLAGTGESLHDLDKAFRFAAYFSVSLAVILLILIPLPLFFTSYIFTKSGFTGWVAISFVWVFFSICAVVIYPVVESRKALGKIFRAMWADIRGRRESPTM